MWAGRWAWAFVFPMPTLPPVSNKPYGFCGRKAPCMKKKQTNTELRGYSGQGGGSGILYSLCPLFPQSPINRRVSVDVKHHEKKKRKKEKKKRLRDCLWRTEEGTEESVDGALSLSLSLFVCLSLSLSICLYSSVIIFRYECLGY